MSLNNKPIPPVSTSYQKLSHRLTPLSSNSQQHPPNPIIRISAKNTPTTSNFSPNPPLINRITCHQPTPPSLHSRYPTSSLTSSLSKQITPSISSKLIRSQVMSSTRNWQAQCTTLKQTLDYYKSRLVELQTNKGPCNNIVKDRENVRERNEVEGYKVKLQQTEQRMNQENAYLRECLGKLNGQLQTANRAIPVLENNQMKLEGINDSLMNEIRVKSGQLQQLQRAYNQIISQVKEQKCIGYNVEAKLGSLEDNIRKLQEENIQLQEELEHNKRIKERIEFELKDEKAKHQYLVKSYNDVKQEALEYKKSMTRLQQQLKKIQWDNDDMKKVLDTEYKRSMVMTKSAYFNNSFESDSTKLNNSCLITSNVNEGKRLKNKQIKKSYSTVLIQEVSDNNQFNMKEYQEKSQEYRLLRMCIDIQKLNIPENVCLILNLGEYFKQSTDTLFNQKSKLRSTIQKYKKLVDISWENPNHQQQEKSQQFITDLIEKCNLYESSLHEKKNTINLLHDQLRLLKRESNESDKKGDIKQSKHSSREPKLKYKYLDRQDQCQKQKLIINKLEKQVDTLNMKLCESTNDKFNNKQKQRQTKKIVSANTSTDSINPLEKIRSFKPVSSASTTKLLQTHPKLKNISGEQIVKQMQNKLKFYQAQVVPQLQAKISQYKGMLDTFEKQYTQSNIQQPQLDESKVSIVSTNSVLLKQSWKRRRRLHTSSFSDFRESTFKQSIITKPQTSDSNISTQRKRRLDQLTPNTNIKVMAAITLRLCEIGQRMTLNSNYSIILPSSVYLINYSDQYVGSLKVKILETPKERMNEVRRYWAPENLLGYPMGELSLVWNLGMLIDQTIHGELYWKKQEEIIDMKSISKFTQIVMSVQNQRKMLDKEMGRRISLKEVERIILGKQQQIFN